MLFFFVWNLCASHPIHHIRESWGADSGLSWTRADWGRAHRASQPWRGQAACCTLRLHNNNNYNQDQDLITVTTMQVCTYYTYHTLTLYCCKTLHHVYITHTPLYYTITIYYYCPLYIYTLHTITHIPSHYTHSHIHNHTITYTSHTITHTLTHPLCCCYYTLHTLHFLLIYTTHTQSHTHHIQSHTHTHSAAAATTTHYISHTHTHT